MRAPVRTFCRGLQSLLYAGRVPWHKCPRLRAIRGQIGPGPRGTRLAHAFLVVTSAVSSGMSARVRASSGARRAAGGFSLIELMVVIIIVGILAVMAIPTMLQARLDRNAYDDAGAIMQLFRNARTRAVARGGAVLISMTSSTGDRGTFLSYEAVSANAGLNWAGLQANQTPVGTCKAPTAWIPLATSNPGVQLIDGVNLNGTIETDANIWASLWSYSGTTATNFGAAWICFTPLGHVYFTTSTTNPLYGTTNPFDGVLPMVSPLEFRVTRYLPGGTAFSGTAFGTTRSVLLPPNGMTRIFSHI
jgi:prepilin-type N-terminal cleavage/methylation domain-containing protein